MPLEDALGVDPQGVVNDLVAQRQPDLAQAGPVDPQAVLDRLIRKQLARKPSGQRPTGTVPTPPPQPAPSAPEDFSAYGHPGGPVDEDFASFGKGQEEEPPKPEEASTASIAGRAFAEPIVKGAGEMLKAGPVLKRAAEQSEVEHGPAMAEVPMGEGLTTFTPEQKAARQAAAQQRFNAAPIEKEPVYQAGEAIKKLAPELTPEERQTWTGTIAGTAGGVVSPILAGTVGTLVGGPLGGAAAATAQIAAQSAGAEFDRAKEKGASDEKAADAAGLSAVIMGATGAIPVGVVLGPVRQWAPALTGRAWAALTHAAESGITFAGVGEAQQWLGQQIAQQYDPNAKYEFDVKRLVAELLTGAATGGVTGAIRGTPEPTATPGFTEKPGETPEERTERYRQFSLQRERDREKARQEETKARNAKPAEQRRRSKLEESAAAFGEFKPEDISAWSLSKLREYVTHKSAETNKASDAEVLKRAGATEDDLAGMDEGFQKHLAEQMRKAGVHAGPEQPAEGTREAPVNVETPQDVAAAGAAVDQEHTPNEGKANNRPLGHAKWHGLDVSLEAPAGGIRRGLAPDGTPFEQSFTHDYGYIRRTLGADGDKVDAYLLGPGPQSVVMDELDQAGGFRQHKLFLGATSEGQVRQAYLGTQGKQEAQIGGMRTFSTPEALKVWLKGNTSKPVAPVYKGETAGGAAQKVPAGVPESVTVEHGPPVQPVSGQAAGTEATVLPDLPRRLYAEVEAFASTDAGAAVQGHLPELRRRLFEAGETPEAALQAVWGPELANAPRGLRQAIASAMVLPPVPPPATPNVARETSPQHVAAVAEALRAIGEDPAHADYNDILPVAAALHAEGRSPQDAVLTAITHAAIAEGVITPEQAEKFHGQEVSAVLAATTHAAHELRGQTRGAGPGGQAPTPEELGEAVPSGGENRPRVEGEAAEGGAPTKAAGAVGEAAGAGHPEAGAGVPAGEPGAAQVSGGRTGGEAKPEPGGAAAARPSAEAPAKAPVKKTPQVESEPGTKYVLPGFVTAQYAEGGVTRKPGKPAKAEKSDWTEVGKNYIGQTLYEDQRGVRSYIENGVRHTEPVAIRPTRGGVIGAPADRTAEWLLPNERTDEHWWDKELTTAGRADIIKQLGLRMPAKIAWRNVPEEAQKKLVSQRAPVEKPPAEEAIPEAAKPAEGKVEEKPAGIAEVSKTPVINLAHALNKLLIFGHPITPKVLQVQAEAAFGSKLSQGKFDRKDMYDALELAINLHVKQNQDLHLGNKQMWERVLESQEKLLSKIPTQTVRSEEQVAFQQFSTPPHYAMAVAYAANLRPHDVILEPSAGTGSLVAAATRHGTTMIANELSPRRAAMLREVVGKEGRVTTENAEQLNNILPKDIKPTVVVMNPPFSQTAGRMGDKRDVKVGANHIEQALKRLEPGGRLVAIVGRGMSMEAPGFKDFWARVGNNYATVRANIAVSGDVYKKYGTTFGTRLLVIDKVPIAGSEQKPVTGEAQTVADLVRMLEPIRDARPTLSSAAEQQPAQPGSPQVVAGGEGVSPAPRPAPVEPSALGPGERGGGGVAGQRPAGGGEPTGKPIRVEGGERPGVAPVEPERPGEPVGAGAKPVAGVEVGGQPEVSGGGGPVGNLQPPAGGQPGAPAGGERIAVEQSAPGSQGASKITDSLYEDYTPQRVKIEGAKKHPGPLVESAAMASVLPPAPTYSPTLPKAVINKGLLSLPQLEAVVYAGQAHQQMLPAGEGETPRRKGHFIGDGTGVGKGREIAGIILDNWKQGRTKAVWVSEKRKLLNDAQRDWSGIGQDPNLLFNMGKVKAGEAVKAEKGIAFVTYDTLKNGMSDQAALARGGFVRGQKVTVNGRPGEIASTKPQKVSGVEQYKVKFEDGTVVPISRSEITQVGQTNAPKTRVDQLVDWFGKDFDGVVAFDEAHNMGNAVQTKGARGQKDAAMKALAGLELQKRLPNARVVYVSATGATEVSNLAYAERLGLWGRGTPFASRAQFVSDVSSGGIAAMELIARDMKQLGLYTARNLSYDGVDYDRLEHKLSPDQREIYDTLAEAWQVVLRNINKALDITDANSKAKSSAMSAFWGGHQRFFNQVITSLQMPSVIKAAEKNLAAGRQVAMQLVNTNEASQERAAAKAETKEDIEDLDITPKDQIIQLVQNSFPTQQYESFIDQDGNEGSRPVFDSEGKPVQNAEAVAARDLLIDQLASIRVPQGPLDMILDHFGIDNVAEVTGRGRRFVIKEDEKTGEKRRVEESRPGSANQAETDAYQAGKKKIIVFSDAGGTGGSFHADNDSQSANARRAHYLVQAGWRADKAIQGLGRSHRANQKSAPSFHLVTTDLDGQKRFISSIARRLGQLGALTKGQRQAGDQGIFSQRDNLESTEAKDALRQFFTDLYNDRVEGVGIDDFENQTGLKLRTGREDEDGNFIPQGLRTDLPVITQFLNRLLSLKIDLQNKVFQAFSNRLDNVIEAKQQAGTLDAGLETVRADKIAKDSEQIVHLDKGTNAETKYVKLTLSNRFVPTEFKDVVGNKQRPVEFFAKSPQGRVYAVAEAPHHTDADSGRIIPQYRLTGPGGGRLIKQSAFEEYGTKWGKIEKDEAQKLWQDEIAKAPEFVNRDLHLITGTILPIWDRLKGSARVVRLNTDKGERLIGRIVPDSKIAETLRALGAEAKGAQVTPENLHAHIMDGGRATLANGWKLTRRTVAGEHRIELTGPSSPGEGRQVEMDGVFSERIGYDKRYFIPSDPEEGAKVLARLTEHRPVVEMGGREPEAGFGAPAPRGWTHAETSVPYSPPPFRSAPGNFTPTPGSPLGGQAQAHVLARGQDTGVEHLIAIDRQGRTAADTVGAQRYVSIPPDLERRLADPSQAIVVHHNHPTGGATPSIQDVAQLGYPGLKAIWAHTPTGSARAELTAEGKRALSRFPDNDTRRQIIAKHATAVDMSLWPMGAAAMVDGKVSEVDANLAHSHLVNLILHRANLIDYQHNIDIGDYVEQAGLAPYIQRAISAIRRVLFDEPAATHDPRPDRLPPTLRHPGDLGTSFRGRPEIAGRVREGAGDRARGAAYQSDEANRGAGLAAPQRRTPPPQPPGNPAAQTGKMRTALSKAVDILDEAQIHVTPMSVGSPEAKAAAKDYANAKRLAQWQWGQEDDYLKRNYSPQEQVLMWQAADEENVFRQHEARAGTSFARAGYGLERLNPKQRADVDRLVNQAKATFEEARDVGIIDSEGLPYYVPRIAVMMDEEGHYYRPGFVGQRGEAVGAGFRTTTPQMKHRKYMTAEETQAAMKAKLGEAAVIARNIRALPLATAKLQEAIAGRTLINEIKAIGSMAGVRTVHQGGIPNEPGWFTMNHPAFKTWRPVLNRDKGTGKWEHVHAADGTPLFESEPLHIREEFRGPLKAVLSQDSGKIYQGLMAIKGKSMALIMYSPVIHNMVEYSRSLPAFPLKVASTWIYWQGNRAKNDPPQMRQAISAGMVPIGKRFFNQDITSIMEEPNIAPGRSTTAKIIGAIPGLFSARGGDATKRAIDAMGDVWHNKLLWDRVGDLQMGLYVNFRDSLVRKGFDPLTASRMAAHFANRYAGALPIESMSAGARKLANVVFFSRSLTFGNLGAMKDMLTGLPPDVKAQIIRDAGDQTVRKATSFGRRKAIAIIALDIALNVITTSLLEDVFKKLRGDNDWTGLTADYGKRFMDLMQHMKQSPIDVLTHPMHALWSLSSTATNEQRKREGMEARVHLFNDAHGRGIYGKNPAGKIGEEFYGWPYAPGDMFLRKMSQFVKGPLQALLNDKYAGAGFDRPTRIWRPDPEGWDWVKNVGRIAVHMAGGFIPLDALASAFDFVFGNKEDWRTDAAKVLGPVGGFSISKGHPGGPPGALKDFKARQKQYDKQFQDEQARRRRTFDERPWR